MIFLPIRQKLKTDKVMTYFCFTFPTAENVKVCIQFKCLRASGGSVFEAY